IERAKARFWLESLARAGQDEEPARPAPTPDTLEDLGHANGVVLDFFVGPNATFLVCSRGRQTSAHRLDVGAAELTELVRRERRRCAGPIDEGRSLRGDRGLGAAPGSAETAGGSALGELL